MIGKTSEFLVGKCFRREIDIDNHSRFRYLLLINKKANKASIVASGYGAESLSTA